MKYAAPEFNAQIVVYLGNAPESRPRLSLQSFTYKAVLCRCHHSHHLSLYVEYPSASTAKDDLLLLLRRSHALRTFSGTLLSWWLEGNEKMTPRFLHMRRKGSGS